MKDQIKNILCLSLILCAIDAFSAENGTFRKYSEMKANADGTVTFFDPMYFAPNFGPLLIGAGIETSDNGLCVYLGKAKFLNGAFYMTEVGDLMFFDATASFNADGTLESISHNPDLARPAAWRTVTCL